MGSVALNRTEDATICETSGSVRKLFTTTDKDCRGKRQFYPALLCVQDNWRYTGNCFKNPGQVTHRLMTFTSRVKISLYMYLVCPVNVFFNTSVFQNGSCRCTTAKENLSSTRSKGGTVTVVLTFERGNLLIMEDSYYYYCT